MKKSILSIAAFLFGLCSYAQAVHKSDFVEKYYELLSRYAMTTEEDIELAEKIEGLHVGDGYVYPDVEIELGGLVTIEGVKIRSVYLASISSRLKYMLKFVPDNISLGSNSNGICTMAYTLSVYGNSGQTNEKMLYSVPLIMEIRNDKIISILKGESSIPPQDTLIVSTKSLAFDASGGTRTITVNSNTDWSVGNNTASWVHLTHDENTLTLRVDANTNTKVRTYDFKIKAGWCEETIRIIQSKGEESTMLSVSDTYFHFGYWGGTEKITVKSNTDWSVSVNTASWGHLTRDENTLTLRVDANNKMKNRTDFFKIKAGSQEKRITITQSGKSISDVLDDEATWGISYDYAKDFPLGLSGSYSYSMFMIGLDAGYNWNNSKDKYIVDSENYPIEDIDFDPKFYITATPSFYYKYFAVGCGVGVMCFSRPPLYVNIQQVSDVTTEDNVTVTQHQSYASKEYKLQFMIRPTVKVFIPTSEDCSLSLSVAYNKAFGYTKNNGFSFGLGLQFDLY